MAKTNQSLGTLATAAAGVLAAVGMLMAIMLVVGDPAGAAFPGKNGKIAFVSNRDGNEEIYTMNAGTSREDRATLKRLTNSPAPDLDPAFSPDGSKIVFSTTERDGNQEIYIINSDGTGLKRLTNEPAGDLQPTFSPDGTKIIFTSTRDSYNPRELNYEIYIMNSNGAGLAPRLTTNPAFDSEPAFSPNGTKIAFKRKLAGSDSEIYTMKADGSGQTQLTKNTAVDSQPAFSPDGSKIAFTSTRDNGKWEIYIMNSDGTGQTKVPSKDPAPNDSEPAFSPDGKWIIYTFMQSSGQSGIQSDIFARTLDGTSEQRLTSTEGRDMQPDWQPLR